MGKTLVVCYSRSGNTRIVGQEIAKLLGADFEEVLDTKDRKGIIGFIKSGFEASKKRTTVLKPMKTNPANYDSVIVGSPVWAAALSTPILTYFKEHKGDFKKVSFFYTSGGNQTNEFLDQIKEFCGKAPAASIGVTQGEIKKGEHLKKIKDFAVKLK